MRPALPSHARSVTRRRRAPQVPTEVSLAVVVASIGAGVGASLLLPPPDDDSGGGSSGE